jgi:hypothetical protein
VTEWNPTDDELRLFEQSVAQGAVPVRVVWDLARLVLREREVHKRSTGMLAGAADKHRTRAERAEAERDEARTGLAAAWREGCYARDAQGDDPEDLPPNPYQPITPPTPADPLTEARIAEAIAAARANQAFMNRLAERIEQDRDLLDRLAAEGGDGEGALYYVGDCRRCWWGNIDRICSCRTRCQSAVCASPTPTTPPAAGNRDGARVEPLPLEYGCAHPSAVDGRVLLCGAPADAPVHQVPASSGARDGEERRDEFGKLPEDYEYGDDGRALPESASATCADCHWTASGPWSRWAAREHQQTEGHVAVVHHGLPASPPAAPGTPEPTAGWDDTDRARFIDAARAANATARPQDLTLEQIIDIAAQLAHTPLNPPGDDTADGQPATNPLPVPPGTHDPDEVPGEASGTGSGTPRITPPRTREVATDWLDFLAAKWCATCNATHMGRAQFDALLDLARSAAEQIPAGTDG